MSERSYSLRPSGNKINQRADKLRRGNNNNPDYPLITFVGFVIDTIEQRPYLQNQSANSYSHNK